MWLRWALFPLSVLYDAITRLRNHLYNSGYKPSIQFEVRTVVVGNLNVGGSGKTPMIEYLVRLLKKDYQVATLSRGYGRRTRGFRLADQNETARTLGDEPLQLYKKFGSEVAVAVGEERALAIPHILHERPEVNVVLLDDAYQHRTIQGHLSILLTEYNQPFYNDWLMPTGNLRETGFGARRADIIVVTKCPDGVTDDDQESMRRSIAEYAGAKPVFFSTIRYDEPVGFGALSELKKDVVLVTGIARTAGLEAYVNNRFTISKHFNFRDHHPFKTEEIRQINEWAAKHHCSIITTEKDMVRLTEPDLRNELKQAPWFYLPIQMTFLGKAGANFDSLFLDKLKSVLN